MSVSTHNQGADCGNRHCRHCAARRAGLGAGPYTPTEYAALERELDLPPPVLSTSADYDVETHPAVVAARAELDRAEAAHEPLHRAWLEAAAAVRRAELLQMSTVRSIAEPAAGSLHRLREAHAEALEERDANFSTVCRARDRVRGALRQAAAEMSGYRPAVTVAAGEPEVRRSPGVRAVDIRRKVLP